MKIPTKIEIKKFINNNSFINSNFVFKFIVSIFIFIFALIPTWVYLLIRWFIEPHGFWQEFAILAASSVALGWLQIILIVIGGTIILQLLLEDNF